MRFLRRLLLAVSVAGLCSVAVAQTIESGVDYDVLERAGMIAPGKKVEVTEFFGYFCPHCYALDPALEEWVKKQGDKITFSRLHTSYFGKTLPQQRMYFTLEAMGKGDDLHKKIFEAIHQRRLGLNDEKSIQDFVTRQGIDLQQYLAASASFSVRTKVVRTAQLESFYRLAGVPNIVIDGRYVASPGIAGRRLPKGSSEAASVAALMPVLDALVNKAAAERAATAK
ncbi:MAG: thiol:disulfide interchange protein DsbA/DsbL [Pseudomonadota bacterium]